MYSMKDLSSRVKKTPQALYSLIKQNQDLSSIIKQNSEKSGRFIKYGEPVLNWLLDYYGTTQPISNQEVKPEAPTKPQEDPVSINNPESSQERINALEGKIEALTATIKEKEAEIEFFKNQNSQLLLLLQMEKQENILLLSQPKKSFVERVRNYFTKSKKEIPEE